MTRSDLRHKQKIADRIGAVVLPLLLIPVFFLLGVLYFSRYPNSPFINQSMAQLYNSQQNNNMTNFNGRNLAKNSYIIQGSEPQVGIGGGGPTIAPTINFCPATTVKK